MFHALPGEAINHVIGVLADIAARQLPFTAEVSGVRSLGNGVAFNLQSAVLESLRRKMADVFHEKLTRQDRQVWQPHITVQNKVSAERARELLTRLEEDFRPWTVSIEGFDLWRYDSGPWEFAERFPLGVSHPSTAAK